MRASIAVFCALFAALHATADACEAGRTVDLRSVAALEQLQQSNPGHFVVIQQILAGLAASPARAEEGWLQTEFAVRDVSLSGLLIHTSNPPKQLLRFTLGDSRYTMYLTRSDMVAGLVPAVSR
jgi:hypothetical protein